MLVALLVACIAAPAEADSAPAGADSAPAEADAAPCAHDTGGGDTARAPHGGDTAVAASGGAGLVVYAVRHAEREEEGDDPGLTEEGQARAEALVPLLAHLPLAAVYASDARRTQETAAPTAADHDLPVLVFPDPDDRLAAQLLAAHGGDVVLHAGHSDTLPPFFSGLGVAEPPTVSGYGQLWIVRVDAAGCATVETSHFGS